MGNFTDDISIGLILSRACNLQCSYCMQRKLDLDRICVQQNNKRLDDIVNFIQGIEERKPKKYKTYVSFYGGEPLLSFNDMKYVVDHLKRTERFRFLITTNGKLLTQEIVNWLNKYKVFTMISWDGSASKKKRGYDALEDKHDLIMQLNSVAISSVVDSDSTLFDRLEEVSAVEEEYFGIHDRHMDDRGAVYVVKGGTPEESYPPGQLKQDVLKLLKKSDAGYLSYIEWHWLNDLIHGTEDFAAGKCWEPAPCSCIKGTMISVTMDGAVTGCINTDGKIATIDDSLETISAAVKKTNYTNLLDDCIKCPYSAIATCVPACRLEQMLNKEVTCSRCKAYGEAKLSAIKEHYAGKK